MRAITQQAIDIFEQLDEVSQALVLKYAENLAAENDKEYLPYDESEMAEDIALFDEAMANDDGCRISGAELRREYGL